MPTIYDYARLAQATDRHGIAKPKAVREALDLHAAATVLRERIAAETVPNLEEVTAATVGDTLAALCAHDGKAQRLAHASQLVAVAERKVMIAWGAALDSLHQKFGALFDNAAADFTGALADLDGNLDAQGAIDAGKTGTLTVALESAATLTDLREVRGLLANMAPRADVSSDTLERWSRTLVLPDRDTLARRIPIRTGEHRDGTAGWWAALVGTPGVRVAWRTPAQQFNDEQQMKSRKAAAA